MRLIDSGLQSGKEIMKKDEDLLETLRPNDPPILHFYRFQKKTATYGHFLDPAEYINLSKAEEWGLHLAKRPTGGGIIFHIWDFAFSVLIPAHHPGYFPDPLKNYAFIHEKVLQAIQTYPLYLLPEDPTPLDDHAKAFCMAKPTKYDIMIEGKKIVGAAQRKKKQGYLHQGSISLATPNFAELSTILHPGTQVIEAMQIYTASLLGSLQEGKAFSEQQDLLQQQLQQVFVEPRDER